MKKLLRKYGWYYLLLILPVTYFILFKYVPMAGNVIAFRSYKPGGSIFGIKWVGFRYFKMFLNDPFFLRALKNTFILSFGNLLVNFPVPIIFALMLNEIKSNKGKRLVQTIAFLPSFIAVVIVMGIVKEMLSPSTGIVNEWITWLRITDKPVFFVNDPKWFRPIYILTDMWQYTGRSAVIYIAALAGVNPTLYEVAKVDGASRWKQTIHVTLPGIMPTIAITLVLRVGTLLTLGFEKALLLQTPVNTVTSDIIDTFVYRQGLLLGNYSYATAVGLFSGVIGFILILATNMIVNRSSQEKII